jgi:hypothetical protein
MDAADTAYIDCLVSAARELDDGKSDAATIAGAVVPICTGKASIANETHFRVLPDAVRQNPGVREGYYQHDERDQQRVATDTVLRLRAARRQNSN